jgi:hypothetical protein
MRRRALTWLAWLLCAASLVLGAAGAVFGARNGYSPIELVRAVAVGVILAVTFPLVGALIASRRPGNPLGWIFCVIGLSQGLVTAGWEYGTYALRTAPGSVPGGALASWFGLWSWALGLGLLITFALLLFPDGRLPSPRWRPLAWLSAVPIAIFCGPVAAAGWPLRGPALLDPAGEPAAPPLLELLGAVAFPLMLLCGVACLVALALRFRRSRGIERQQLKWFVFAGAVTVAGVLLTEGLGVAEGSFLDGVLALAGLAVVPSIPVAAGIAILRHRLYDIDRLVNRTLVYGLLTGLLAGVYAAGALWLPRLLGAGRSELAVAASTLAVAAAFQPARRRVQALVDRRFDRARYDAARTVEAFSARLRDQVDLDSLAAELLAVVDRTVQPAGAWLWLRPPAGRSGGSV